MIVIVKDLRGYRLCTSMDDGDGFFKLDNGDIISADIAWPATSNNIQLAAVDYSTRGVQRLKMKPLGGECDISMDPVEVVAMLRKQNCDIDEEFRIRRRMLPPYTEIEEGHIMPIIASHEHDCEEKKKDPATVPVQLLWMEGQIIFKLKDQPAAGKKEGGRISLCGKQVVLSLGDWHYVPKNSHRGMLVHFLKCEPTGATSMKELCGKDKFLAEDGVLCNWGLKALTLKQETTDFKEKIADVSVDDIIKGVQLD